jgi:Predicted pyridoxal phosphate-dependent enzyme apparently involved in regulation of cell wall biogenesis
VIPISSPSLTGRERDYLLEAFDSGWISSRGAFVERAEELLRTVTAAEHAAVVTNGTVALHLALLAAGVGPGDEVIMPGLSYVATMNAALYVGARPVLVDVDPFTWNVDPDAVEAAVGERTRAIVAVDLYGNVADYSALRRITRPRGIVLIADAAESIGGSMGGIPTGSLADISVFSFFGNKVVTSGEGGAITTDDSVYAARVQQLRNQGNSLERRYFHDVLGYNYRMTNLAAAVLCAQLERLGELTERRREVLAWYESRLRGCERIRFQGVRNGVEPSPWMMTVRVDGWSADERDAAIVALSDAGVETRPAFVPMQHMPYAADLVSATTPIGDQIGSEGISLPTFPDLTEEQVDEVCQRLAAVVGDVNMKLASAERP